MIEHCIAPAEIKEGDLVAYLEGEASPQVTGHIARCSICAAEVEALAQINRLLSQALAPADSQVIELPTLSQPTFVASGSNLSLEFDQQGQSQWRWSLWLNGQNFWRPAFALTSIFVVVTVLVVIYQFTNSPVTSEVAISTISTEETIAATVRIAGEAAVPDVDRSMLIQDDSRQASVIAEVGLDVANEPAFLETDRYRMIRQRIIDVSVASQIIIEESFEIAPPVALLREYTSEAQTQNLFIHSTTPTNAYRVKSSVMDAAGNRYVVRVDNYHGSATLYLTYSTDAGRTWSQDIEIYGGVGHLFNPHLAIDDQGHLYVVWQNWYNIGRHVFYFARSTDNGQTWSDVIRIDDDAGRTYNPDLAVDAEGKLSVTWQNRRSAKTGIYFTRSTDGGQTWSDKVRVAHLGS